ncbi:hypothetical protein M0R88_14105 [Halorussus gelatinilyticus]|uniref:Secreted glycoprotein n=1 Tax=Halorussus gelatinilyticus TaxID=2937524 RepID=A0A8U0IF92_9EURY|nr:hypothetical protein [Halorussus gelatinilyticus]UPV99642.1 hypothetical protein M0R88_14105 [Halorussus gelatinilyticus]
MTGRTPDSRRLRDDTRSVSITVNYALNLVVATMLIGGVLTATGGMVQDRRESAVRTELSVVGERVASDLMAADRLAEVGSAGPGTDPTVSISVTLPERVGGTRYDVSIRTSPAVIVLRSDTPEVTVRVGFHHDTPVEETTVRGGNLRIELAGDGDVEVVAA